MDQKTFVLLAGVIFALVVLHLLRIYMGWPAVIGGWAVPMWLSWLGLVVAGGLAYFGLILLRHRRRRPLDAAPAPQQGHRGSVLMSARINRARMVAIEFGM
jgi:hypothetical protein